MTITTKPSSTGEQEAVQHARTLAALGHPVRLRIFSYLIEHGEMYVDEIVARLSPMGQAAISYQLARLKNAGLVESHKSGSRIYYRATPDSLRNVAAFLESLLGGGRD